MRLNVRQTRLLIAGQVATFPGVDPILEPEMRSTGEVLGLAENFPLAFYKAEEAAGSELPHAPAAWENKKVLISLSNKEGQKEQVLTIGKTLSDLGFTLVATQGTADFYNENASFANFNSNTDRKTR